MLFLKPFMSFHAEQGYRRRRRGLLLVCSKIFSLLIAALASRRMVVVIIGGPVELAHPVLQVASTPEKTQGGSQNQYTRCRGIICTSLNSSRSMC